MNIPKKLDKWILEDKILTDRMFLYKLNEIIDYLQAKEEASKCTCEVVPGLGIKTNYSCPEHGYQHSSLRKASKGEDLYGDGDKFEKEKLAMKIRNTKLNDYIESKKASKGECTEIPCTHCTYGNPSCKICHKNLPEHDIDPETLCSKCGNWKGCHPIKECKAFVAPEHEEEFEKRFGERLHGWTGKQELKDYIRDNFEPKRKKHE